MQATNPENAMNKVKTKQSRSGRDLVADLILVSPQTGANMNVVSRIGTVGDKSIFFVGNSQKKWKVIIQFTEET